MSESLNQKYQDKINKIAKIFEDDKYFSKLYTNAFTQKVIPFPPHKQEETEKILSKINEGVNITMYNLSNLQNRQELLYEISVPLEKADLEFGFCMERARNNQDAVYCSDNLISKLKGSVTETSKKIVSQQVSHSVEKQTKQISIESIKLTSPVRIKQVDYSQFQKSTELSELEKSQLIIFFQCVEIERLNLYGGAFASTKNIGIEKYEKEISYYKEQLSIMQKANSTLEMRIKSFDSGSTFESTKWKEEKSIYELEIRKMKEEFSSSSSRISYLLRENTKLSDQIVKLELYISQSNIASSNLNDLQNKVFMLTQEIERLNMLYNKSQQSLEMRMVEISHFKQSISQYELRIHAFQSDLLKTQKLVEFHEQSVKNYKFEYEMLNKKLELQRIQFSKSSSKNNEAKISLLIQEIEHLKAISRKKTEEIQEWSFKYAKLENEFSQKVVKYEYSEQEIEANSSPGKQKEGSGNKEINLESVVTKKIVKKGKGSQIILCGGGSTKHSFKRATIIKLPNVEKKEFEHKISILSQELEHIKDIVKMKEEESQKFRKAFEETEHTLIKCQEHIQILEARPAGPVSEQNGHQEYEEIVTTTVQKTSSRNDDTALCCGLGGGSKHKSFKSMQFKENSLHSILKKKDQEIIKWTKDYELLEKKLKKYVLEEQEENLMIEKLTQLEEQVKYLKEEKVVYSSKILALQEEISTIKILEIQLKESFLLIEELREKIIILERDQEELVRIKRQLKSNEMIMTQLILCFIEIDKLTIIVQKYEQEIVKWKSDYYRLEISIQENTTILFLQEQIDKYQKEVHIYEETIIKKDQEISGFMVTVKEYNYLELKIQEYIKIIEEYKITITNLKIEINIKIEEIKKWKFDYSSLEIQVSEFKQWEVKYTEYEEKILELLKEIERLNLYISEKVLIIDKLKEEKSSLYHQYESYKNETKVSTTKIEEYKGQISKFTLEIQEYSRKMQLQEESIQGWKLKYSKVEGCIEEHNLSQESIKQLTLRTHEMQIEITRLGQELVKRDEEIYSLILERKQITSQIKDINVVQIKVQEYSDRNIKLSQENYQLQQIIEEKCIEINNFYEKIREIEMKQTDLTVIQEFETRIAFMTQEIERLHNVLQMREREITQLKISGHDSKKIEIEKTSHINITNDKSALLTQEIQRLRIQLSNRDQEINSLKEGKPLQNIYDQKMADLNKLIEQQQEENYHYLGYIVLLQSVLDSRIENQVIQ